MIAGGGLCTSNVYVNEYGNSKESAISSYKIDIFLSSNVRKQLVYVNAYGKFSHPQSRFSHVYVNSYGKNDLLRSPGASLRERIWEISAITCNLIFSLPSRRLIGFY